MNIPSEKIIDIRELRIGNYLLYDGKIVHVTLLSMDIDDEYEESIGFCELGKTTNEKADWNRALCDKLDRIPLRPEWLDRLGVSFGKGLGYGYPFAENFNLYLTQRPWNAVECTVMQYSEGDELLQHIKYVHQLQNLYFSLTGEELTIKELQP